MQDTPEFSTKPAHDPQASVSLGAVAGRILSLMKPWPWRLYGSIVCATLAACLALSTHVGVALALVALLGQTPDWALLRMAALVGLGGMVARHVFFALATALSHSIAFHVQADLRNRIAVRLASVPLAFFDEATKGSLRKTLLDDVEGIEDGMAHMVPETGAALITPLLALIALFVIDWRLALLTLVPVLAGVLLLGGVMRRGEAATRAYFDIQARMAAVSGELADALPTVRAFNQSEQATARGAGAFADMTRFSNQWMQQAVVPAAFAQILLSSHLLLAAPAGLLMAAAGWIDLPRFVAFVALAFGLGDVFSAFQGVSHRLMRQVQSLERIDALLDAAPMPEPERGDVPSGTTLEARGLCFSYGARRVLENVSFRLEAGRCLALVGPSGSGKSTLARLIGRFQDVEAGAITLGGVDLRAMQADELHRHIAYVFQDVFLFSGTVAENIRLGCPTAPLESVIEAARKAQAHEFIMRLPQGYETPLGERGASLSGGERQRLSIARALLKNAPILVLDEATAFADPENEALIQRAISELTKGRALIVIAHRLHTIAHADEILVLDEGRVAERGTFDVLMTKDGLFARLWASQQGEDGAGQTPDARAAE